MVVFTRTGAHDVGGMEGLGSVPIEVDEPRWHAAWEGRALGATICRPSSPGCWSPRRTEQ